MPTAAEYEGNKKRTEAELRSQLSAEPDAQPSDASTEQLPPYVPSNPYIVTLVVLTCFCAVVSVSSFIASISLVDSSGNPDAVGRAFAAGFGVDWFAFAILFFIPFLILGSLKWKAPEPDDE